MKSAKNYLQQASQLCRAQQVDQALPLLKEAVQHYPKDEMLLGLLSSVYAELKLFDQAQSHLQTIVMLNPKNYLAMHQLGLLQFQQQQWQTALDYWQPVLEQPDDFLTKYYAAVATAQLGNLSQARTLAEAAQLKAPAEHPVAAEIAKFLQSSPLN